MKLGLWIAPLALFASCDKAKTFIDPSGRAYGNNAPTTTPGAAPSPPSSTGSTTPPPPVSTPPAAVGGKFDAPIRTPASGRNLTVAEALRQIPGIEFQDRRCTWKFHNGLGRCGSSLASLVDSAGKPWGISVGDLDLDGSDDAVVVVRLDRAGEETRWELVFLRNQEGRLFNTHTVALPGHDGFRDVDIEGNAVLLVPEAGGPNVSLYYSGGELTLARP